LSAVDANLAVLRSWVAQSLGIATEAPQLLSAEEEQATFELAEQHRVAGLLGRPAARASLTSLDETTRANLQRAHRQTVAANLVFLHMFRAAGRELTAAKIPFAPLKGMWLILRLYQDLGARHMADLDILVPAGMFWRACKVITAAGFAARDTVIGDRLPFRAFYDHHFTHPELPGSLLEVHRYFAYRAFAAFNYRQIFHRAVTAQEDDVRYLALCAEDTLLHLAVHGAKHGFRITLRDTADVAAILTTRGNTLRWRQLVDHARAAGAATSLWIALETAQSALGAYLPDGVLDELAPNSKRRDAIGAMIDLRNGTGVRSDDDVARARALAFDTPWRAAWWHCTQAFIGAGDRMRTNFSRMVGG
jgi:putative nucleotidyltransferase-like protein